MTQQEVSNKVLDDPVMIKLYQDTGFLRDFNNLRTTENIFFVNSVSCLCKLVWANVINSQNNAEAYMDNILASLTPREKAHTLGRMIYSLAKMYSEE